eukprot:jgi/Chlat1/1104/Chrsp110S01591
MPGCGRAATTAARDTNFSALHCGPAAAAAAAFARSFRLVADVNAKPHTRLARIEGTYYVRERIRG